MTPEIQRLYNRIEFLFECLDDAIYECDRRGHNGDLEAVMPAFTTMLDDSIELLKAQGYSGANFRNMGGI